MFWHHIAIRNNGNQKEHSVQAMVEVALKVEIRKKEEEVRREKSLPIQRKRILQDLKESHERVIIMDLNIISLEIMINEESSGQKLWKMGLKVKLKMNSVGLQL